MTDRSTSPGTTLEPVIDLQRLVAGIRWRRRLWTTLALAGLVLGLAFSVLVPAASTATTRLYVVHEDEQPGDGESVMKTDVAVLQTTRISAAALELLGVTDERPEDFVRDYVGASPAANVLEITVSGAGRDDAVRRAGALADAFIAAHIQRVEDSAAAESRALLDRRAQIERDLADLNEQIAAGPTATPGASPEDVTSQVAALYAQRSSLGSQIQELAQRAEDASIGAPRVAAGTQIIDAPRVTGRSPLVSAVINGLLGLFVGLAGGLTLAAVVSVVQDRPVLRRDITTHLGASVIAQLPAPHRGPHRLWKRSRPVTERKRVAETLARVVGTAPGGFSLLEIGCPGPTAALALDVVGELAPDGPVSVIDDLPGQPLATAEAPPAGAVRFADAGASDPAADGGIDPLPERVIGVGSVDPGTAWTDLRRLGAETVLVVQAGHADATWLHTVARQLADLEIVVIGVVLVHPDPRDRSDGTLWDGLHTALRGRARSAAPAAEVPPVSATPAESPVVSGSTAPAEPSVMEPDEAAAAEPDEAAVEPDEAAAAEPDEAAVVEPDEAAAAEPDGPDEPAVPAPAARPVRPSPSPRTRNGADRPHGNGHPRAVGHAPGNGHPPTNGRAHGNGRTHAPGDPAGQTNGKPSTKQEVS